MDLNQIDFSTKHGSYNETIKNYKVISKGFNLQKDVFLSHYFYTIYGVFCTLLLGMVLYTSVLIPHFLTSKEPLIDESYLNQVNAIIQKIGKHYENKN